MREVFINGVLRERWNFTTRTVTTFNDQGVQTGSRPFTAAEVADADIAAAVKVQDTNRTTLADVTALQGRLTRLAAYKTDADLTAVLNQTNNQALSTATLNRALKTMVRREERLTAAVAALLRLVDPSLLTSITDTTDA